MAIIFDNEIDRAQYIARDARSVAQSKYPGRTKKELAMQDWLAGILVGFASRMTDVTVGVEP